MVKSLHWKLIKARDSKSGSILDSQTSLKEIILNLHKKKFCNVYKNEMFLKYNSVNAPIVKSLKISRLPRNQMEVYART